MTRCSKKMEHPVAQTAAPLFFNDNAFGRLCVERPKVQ